YIAKNGGLEAAKIKPECSTSNRERLCRNHLSKCESFLEANSAEEIERILLLPDNDKIFVPVIKQGQSSTTSTITRSGSSTSSSNQLITKFLSTPIVSENEIMEPELNDKDVCYQVSDDEEENSANNNEDIITREEEQKWDQLIQE
ncbi:14786_t:CDS:2, partial [Racocetra fulgida]